jgi:ABC-2 type transport system permease protein
MSDIAIGSFTNGTTTKGASRARCWATMAGRCVSLSSRQVDTLITSLALPVMLMLLFVYLFGGAIDPGAHYVTYVAPGVLVLCAGFGAANTAVGVAQDMTTGTVDRFRSMDVSGAAMLAGHVVASVARNVIATALVLGVAVAIGFRPAPSIGGAFAAAGILLAFVVAISWLAAVFGLLAKSAEAANGFTFLLVFLPYPSSAFVKISTMPPWIQSFARHQPVTPVVESIRALALGHAAGANPWEALAWCAGIVAASVAVGSVLFARKAH